LILPAYIGFACHPKNWRSQKMHLPKLILWCLGALTLLVLGEAFNPSVLNWGVALIGIKVWLFYLPLLILGYFWITSSENLLSLFRLMIILSWIPTTIGFVQFIGSHWLGYEACMKFFYGDAAKEATQLFAFFQLGGGTML